jgi:hypothetical protein
MELEGLTIHLRHTVLKIAKTHDLLAEVSRDGGQTGRYCALGKIIHRST